MRSVIPVATIYRYFADRSAIIAALIDRETELIDEGVNERLNKMETVTLEALLDTLIRAHYELFAASRRSIVLWFGARSSKEVLGRVERRYAYLGDWVMSGALRSGMVVPNAPSYGGEVLVWLGDRCYEYIVREDRNPETIESMLAAAVRMLTFAASEFATERGTEGITLEQFWAGFGPFEPPSGPLAK
jgi:AcrR family transcriptional regulator